MANTTNKADNKDLKELQAKIKELEAKNAALEKEKEEIKAQEAAAEDINKETEDYLNERVEVTLFKGPGRYKEDVYVSVDGKAYQIQRGVPVKIPRRVALVIEASEKAKIENEIRFDAQEAAFAAKS